jgi:hypothetical protein
MFRHRFQMHAALACLAAATSSAIAQNPAATVQVDANANRKPISPLIYGANWAGQSDLDELNLTLNRRGGNATTTYNWQINATNRGGDWFFESFGDDGGATPGASADNFINAAKAGGADPMVTIPMVDWVAKVGPNREALTAYSVAKYGAQTQTDPWWPDSGNGIRVSDGLRITDNDPNDAYVPNSPAFQQQWVEHLVNKYGSSTGGGIKYYLTDNEHGVWPYNHAPVMPVGQTMAQIRDRIIAYAGVVKTVDPGAIIVGPEEWGWPNYFSSPYDTQFSGGTDRAANGGWDYMPWLLKEMKAHETATGQRLLDVFSLHYYPQPGEFSQGDSSTAAQLMRNQCTRDLWDPNYTSTSWINNKVKLIPRMRDWVNANYPGTKIAVTEYSWGAESHISGAIAQADVLGIFGREGVDIATFWGGVDGNLPTRNAFKMYRNYDGAKSTFGDTSVSTTVANPDNVSAFAAERASDGSLTVMVLNKYLTGDTPITVNLANFTAASTAQVWQFTSANTIDRLADATVTGGSVSFSAPAQSVTLFVVPDSGVEPSDLRAHYAFEGNSQDSSGSGNHGAATSLSYVMGKLGAQAAQFNGASSSVTIPRSVTDDFTVAMWVKTTDTAGAANAQWWAGKGLVDGEVGGGGADWGTAIVDGKFVLGVGSTGGDTTLASSVNINDGLWHHLVATRSNTSGAIAVYVDGVPSGSGTGPTGSRTLPASLRIGSLQTGNNFLNGTLDDVRLYDRVLSATEVAEFARSPYGGTPWPVPGVIQAEDYDIGGPGFAYNDSDTGNNGGQYRSDGVDVETCAEGGYNIGWANAGEWLEYTVNVAHTGSYALTLRAASESSQIQAHVEFNGVNVTGLMTAPATGGWQTYSDVTAPNVALTAGQHVMRVFFDGGAWNLNHVTLTASPLPAPQNVTASGGSSQIALSWNAVDGAANYVIQRAASSGGPYTELATGVSTTTYADTGLGDGETWHYQVAAQGGASTAPVTATTYTAGESWRFENFGTTANTGDAADSADPDGDSWTNEQEFISGTEPNDASSLLRIDAMQASGEDMNLSFPSVLGRTYRVERSDTLLGESWINVQENISGTGSPIQVTDTGGSGYGKRFYRIVVAR